MFIFSFGTAIVLFESVLIGMLIEHDASDPTIFVSDFWLGSFCGGVLAAYFASKRDGS